MQTACTNVTMQNNVASDSKTSDFPSSILLLVWHHKGEVRLSVCCPGIYCW